MFLTIPTLLTWTRIVAIPLILVVFYTPLESDQQNQYAAFLFILFAITDWVDGFLARRLNQTSAFGAFLDPVADKLLICAALLVLLDQGRISVIVALIIIGREIAISALRDWMAQIGASQNIAVHLLGKVKTAAQMLAIPFLLFDGVWFGLFHTHFWGQLLIWIACVFTLWSMFYYLYKSIPIIRKHLSS